MGNHQTNAKRQHRPSESVGFNKHDSDDERLVTIQRREKRVGWIGDEKESIFFFVSQISTKSAPPFEENNITVNPSDCILTTFSIPAMPFDTHASVTGTFTNWIEHTMLKS